MLPNFIKNRYKRYPRILDLIKELYKLGEDRIIRLYEYEDHSLGFKTTYDYIVQADTFLEFAKNYSSEASNIIGPLDSVWFVKIGENETWIDLWLSVIDTSKISFDRGDSYHYDHDDIVAGESIIVNALTEVVNRLLEVKAICYEEFYDKYLKGLNANS